MVKNQTTRTEHDRRYDQWIAEDEPNRRRQDNCGQGRPGLRTTTQDRTTDHGTRKGTWHRDGHKTRNAGRMERPRTNKMERINGRQHKMESHKTHQAVKMEDHTQDSTDPRTQTDDPRRTDPGQDQVDGQEGRTVEDRPGQIRRNRTTQGKGQACGRTPAQGPRKGTRTQDHTRTQDRKDQDKRHSGPRQKDGKKDSGWTQWPRPGWTAWKEKDHRTMDTEVV
ncbi:pre-mRNA-splicing factor cwc25-like [Haliotis rubra]|uniref:pre-mRNA-splicing factor cwc25-like n=1 Tax=Haliotis rubra TaxID=36100 RepID=UPI001EE4F012|nr:pre-mRNA-splicing factor cwc25-like [Haliotis rubra]